MDGSLNTILVISLILVTGCMVTLAAFVIQILQIIKRIVTKIELRIDDLELTQEEIKLKLLNFIEDVLNKIKNYGKLSKKVGEKTNEKKD